MVRIQKQSSYININVIENGGIRETGLMPFSPPTASPFVVLLANLYVMLPMSHTTL